MPGKFLVKTFKAYGGRESPGAPLRAPASGFERFEMSISYMTQGTRGRKGFFWFVVLECSLSYEKSVQPGQVHLWQQEHKVTGHMCAVRKQVKAGSQVTFPSSTFHSVCDSNPQGGVVHSRVCLSSFFSLH